jgi:glycosyltransferase involved in cell wall biosynthesis
MKILHLRSSGGFYGAENVIWQLAKQHQSGVCSVVASFVDESGDNELLRRCRQDGIPSLPIPCRGMIDHRAIARVRQIIRQQGIDILHTHEYKSTILGLLATAGISLGRVSTNHSWDWIDRKLWFYQRLEGLCYTGFDAIVAVSESVAQQVRPFLRRKQKLSVISNGIDCDSFSDSDGGQRIRRGLGFSQNDFVAGVVGRFSLQKGHCYLLRAAQQLVQKLPHLKFVFWGSGELENELRRQVGEYGLDQSVVFAGVSANMPAVYGAMDLLIIPSLSEGLPMTMLEAMAAGIPVMATPVGDIPKVIMDGKSGFLFASGSVEALIDKMQMVYNNKDSLREVADCGRRIVRAGYSSVQMANEYRKIYSLVVS